VLVGAAVSGIVYGITQAVSADPTRGLFGANPTDTLELKSWIATGFLALAALQATTALWIYGKLRPTHPRWVGRAHRATGAAAILLSLPVAYHCLVAYGFRDLDARTTVHSLVGCFIYGAFAAKILVVRSRGLPRWVLPVAGGTLVTVVVVLWYSSAAWYLNDFSVPIFGGGAQTAPAGGGGSGSTYGSAGGGRAGGAQGGVVRVAYRDVAISPVNVTVKVGQTVRWTNYDGVTHNVVALSGPAKFTSPNMGQGATYTFRPTKAGVYRYICSYHPAQMRGTVTVRG
jgi:plastocyanin